MHTAFLVIALIAIALQAINLYLAFFGRGSTTTSKNHPPSLSTILNSPPCLHS